MSFYKPTATIYIGSNGFAQVGTADYYEKNKVEMAYLKGWFEHNHPVPEEFTGLAWYQAIWQSHDFGRYQEIFLVYNRFQHDEWEEAAEEIDEPTIENCKYERFYAWVNEAEGANIETEEMTAEIENLYAIQMRSNDKHLSVAKTIEPEDDEEPPELKLHG